MIHWGASTSRDKARCPHWASGERRVGGPGLQGDLQARRCAVGRVPRWGNFEYDCPTERGQGPRRIHWVTSTSRDKARCPHWASGERRVGGPGLQGGLFGWQRIAGGQVGATHRKSRTQAAKTNQSKCKRANFPNTYSDADESALGWITKTPLTAISAHYATKPAPTQWATAPGPSKRIGLRPGGSR